MTLDITIKKILNSISTEPRMIAQLVVKGKMTAVEIAEEMRKYAGAEWTPDNSKVTQMCRKLADLGALNMEVMKERKERGPKYYFMTGDARYKVVAGLALDTVAQTGISFYDIFGCDVNVDRESGNSLINTYNVLLNFNGIETYGSLAKKLGQPKTRVWSVINRLKDAGAVYVDDKCAKKGEKTPHEMWLMPAGTAVRDFVLSMDAFLKNYEVASDITSEKVQKALRAYSRAEQHLRENL